MKQIKCELCSGTKFLKSGESFVCQECGCEYSAESVKKLMIEIDDPNPSASSGTPQQANPGVGGNSGMDTRKESLQEINRMLRYFSRDKDIYNRLAQCYASIRNSRIPVGLLIPAIILTSSIVPTLPSVFIYALGELRRNDDTATMIGAIVLIVVLLGACALFWYLFTTIKRERQKAKDEALKEVTRLEGTLYKHFMEFGPCELGFEYTNPSILSRIRNYLASGRAYLIRDAVNLMEQEKSMDALLQQMRDAADSAKRAANAAERTANAAERTSNAAEVIKWTTILKK